MTIKKFSLIVLILFVVSMCVGYASYEALEEYTAATIEGGKDKSPSGNKTARAKVETPKPRQGEVEKVLDARTPSAPPLYIGKIARNGKV